MLRSERRDLRVTVAARRFRVYGTVQGVGFRPFVYRLAERLRLAGWVRNAGDGVEIHAEGPVDRLTRFAASLEREAPRAAGVSRIETSRDLPTGQTSFRIVASKKTEQPTVRISPDLSVCEDCLQELTTSADRRRGYPYINCTNCGPRYSIIERLPYDRPHTTMKAWPMCDDCAAEYRDPLDRRYHAQPVACPKCGPTYRLLASNGLDSVIGEHVVAAAAEKLRAGAICAVKGLGGYHLACDARNASTIRALRQRKFRKEKPFAVMVRSLAEARKVAASSDEAEELLGGPARPIVLMPARVELPGVAPGNDELGIMLPYAPLHVLLFEAGAPSVLVMTSANRSSAPIAFRDDDALERLQGIADFFLVGERPIARRVDDSVVRVGPLGPAVLRRSRGYAPAPSATLSTKRPILALGADLKNTVTLVVNGEAYVSQHIGDLAHYAALASFEETIEDFIEMYRIREDDLLVAYDAHPHYASTQRAERWGAEHVDVQHHRAHVASVAAERAAFDARIIGVALDGTGYGDDGAIWGGELFAGSINAGFRRVAHVRPALLPGGDAAAEHPVQAAAGFLASLDDLPDLQDAPFHFPDRYLKARRLLEQNVRSFPTTSTGRLFDTAAALLGFTRPITFEGQAATWLEQQAGRSNTTRAYPFPDLDYRPLLTALIRDAIQGTTTEDAACAFHLGLAEGFVKAARRLCAEHHAGVVVLSGGVFQNRILTGSIVRQLSECGLRVWMNGRVPCNDGGISLGQAAIASAYLRSERDGTVR